MQTKQKLYMFQTCRRFLKRIGCSLLMPTNITQPVVADSKLCPQISILIKIQWFLPHLREILPQIRWNYLLIQQNLNNRRTMTKSAETRRNARISLKRRETLVQLVQVKKLTVSKAARKVGVKRSTARMIIKKYRETGQLFDKKMLPKEIRRPQIEKITEQSIIENREPEYLQNLKTNTESPILMPHEVTIPQPYYYPPLYYVWTYYGSN